MPSPKRRTTSSSGSSAPSTKKATSPQRANSSATAPASFETVFGTGTTEKALQLHKQLGRALKNIEEMDRLGEPTLALYRARHRQRKARLMKYAEDLREAIRHETADAVNN